MVQRCTTRSVDILYFAMLMSDIVVARSSGNAPQHGAQFHVICNDAQGVALLYGDEMQDDNGVDRCFGSHYELGDPKFRTRQPFV